MRFHMRLLPVYVPGVDSPSGRYFQEILEQVALAEELGWDCYWFTEHHFLLHGGPIPNPAVMIASAAARTRRIHLGSSISILPLHHPVQIAEDYAMADAISEGRLEFGIGSGNRAVDYQVYGVDRSTSRGRFQETAEIITRAWSGERFTYESDTWSFVDVPVYPRPVAQPTPRIWVGAASEDTLGWAGRRGYDIMTIANVHSPEEIGRGVAAWRHGLKESGYDPSQKHIQLHVKAWVDADADRARQVAESAIQLYDEFAQAAREGGPGRERAYDWQGMLDCGRNIYGSPEQCVRGIQNATRYYSFDILTTTFNMGGMTHKDVMGAMELFAKEVMPAFQEAAPGAALAP